jgi:hypothetical protein
MRTPSSSFFESLICEALYFLAETENVQTDTIEARVHSFQAACDGDLVFFEWSFPSPNGQTLLVKAMAHRYQMDGTKYRLSQASIYAVEINGLNVAQGTKLENLEPKLRENIERGGFDLIRLAALQEEPPGYWTDMVTSYTNWAQSAQQRRAAIDNL